MPRGISRRMAFLMLTTLGLVGAAGCGGDTDKRDKVIVKGAITVDGKPMGGVTLAFFSPGEKVAVGTVMTQDDGTYEVMFKAHAGDGNYKVTATKTQSKPGAKTFEKGEGIDDYQMGMAAGSGAAPVHLLPEKYSSIDKTELTAVLQKGQNDGKNFAIKTGK
jgi:hypothetical protein